MVPVAPDAEPLELRGLFADPFFGDFAAAAADLHAGRSQLLFPELFGDQDFDGQAVVVPARHVRRGIAFHGAELGDDIL